MKFQLLVSLLTAAMMLFGVSAKAGGISEEQARTKAQSFLQAQQLLPSGKRSASTQAQTVLRRIPTGETALYVFNVGEQDGFVIVAGDDRARPILGYSDKGALDADKMPAALMEMLTIYTRQIEMLRQQESKPDSASHILRAQRRISSTMADVAPLLTTSWNQSGPYNDYCPTLNDQTALTGCVATAMAQIANYYEYPKSQVPSLPAYTSSTNKINVSAWGATTFDWANMLDSYDGSENSAQKTAVATLMRYCGQAAQMDYGFTSGAYNGDALYAFKEKLGYNANADFKSAASYSANGWEDLIYKEVSEGRPVYYSALNGAVGCDVSGHAFVIDGYRAEGNYFHVNWGWGGACNGYFNIFALDPSAPESAATSTGWHYQMLAIIGLSPETVNTAKLTKDASGSYLITTADDWNELAANLDAYNGGTFKLTSDISVTTMIGTESVPFSGTFDGQGHTLNVNIDSNVWGAAPFSFLHGYTCIKNLKVQGTVSCSEFHASGLIGSASNHDRFAITITNCEVAVQVNGREYAGGFIGHARYMNPTFTDCVFSGSINGCHDHGCFVGWKEWGSRPVYINCLSIPQSFNQDLSFDFSHPGNGGSESDASLTNCYSSYANGFRLMQGISATPEQIANGSVAHGLQNGSRDWTTKQVWGQQIGTDARPLLTSDTNKRVYQVSFVLNGEVVKTVITNCPIGDKMPTGEDFGLKNATFTWKGATFNSSTTFTSDPTVTVTGTAAFTLTLSKTTNGTININNKNCIPGSLKKVTAVPASGYVVSAITVTDANGKTLPVTPVSNASNEYVFVFPKSSVTVNAEFTTGTAEATRFINHGMTLPLWDQQPFTADTWTIWCNEYDGSTVGVPPVDALGHQWYEEGYILTNNEADKQPNGNKIVWENHTAPFGNYRNYDYFRASGGDDKPGNFYMRRVFTFDNVNLPEKLYLRCNYDDAPVYIYLNGTQIYANPYNNAGSYTCELTPEQTKLIHTDGRPNVLAARGSQGDGDYYLDCGLYDPTALCYEVTGEQTVRVQRNEFLTGDVVIPETVTSNGVAYQVTELPDDVTNDLPYLTSMSIPATVTSLGTWVFWNVNNLQYVKSYIPIYQVDQEKVLIAAPVEVTQFEVDTDCSRIWNNAFKFTDNLTTLTLPRSLTYIGHSAFVGCKSLTDIYAYARTVPNTEGDAFEGVNKKAITVHVYESALESYKQSWGEEFNYVTKADPKVVTLAVDVTTMGTLRTLIEEAAAKKNSSIYDVKGIAVTGTINQDDLRTLAAMCTGVYCMSSIDLSGATIDGNNIDNNMFRDKEKLTTIILPETLEHINDAAFHNCDGLTSIDIPASVKGIWDNAFSDCNNLATVTGMEGLSDGNSWQAWDVFLGTAITQPVYGGSVFLYMPPSLTGEYEMPAGIKMTIAGSMRQSKLSSITLPASLTDLGDDTFVDCPNLVDIYCYAPVPPVCHSGVWQYGFDRSACTVHVPASAVDAYKNADEWRDMGRIVGIVTGDLMDMTLHVATAGTLNDALFDAAVAQAKISDKVLIRNLTVTGSLNASDIAYLNALPNTLYNMVMLDMSGATLENNAVTEGMFQAVLYKSVKLPATVTSIAREAFRDSRRLQEIVLPAAITKIESGTFSGCSALTTVTFSKSSALKRIEEYAFAGLSSLKSIALPASLEYIGPHAFEGCGLTSITIPDNVTEMGDRVVQSCGSLTSITLGNGLTTIPDCWAEYCDNLHEVTLGKKISAISWRAFRGCNIKHVYSYAKFAPSWNDSFYDGIHAEAVLHTYSNSLERYQTADGWKDFPTILGDLGTYPTYNLTVDVATMGGFSEALTAAMKTAGCKDMMDISQLTITGLINNTDLEYLRDHLGASLDKLDLGAVTVENNTLGHRALADCAFKEIILPENLESLQGWYVLENCRYLKTIDIPASVRYVCPEILAGATSLETVTGGEGVTEIDGGNGMYFDNCPNLKSPVILNQFFFRLPLSTVGAYEVPENVTTIARDAMWHVEGLTALTLPESITTIYGNAFAGDKNLKDIYFRTTELPYTDEWAFGDFDKPSCTLHVYEEMVEVFKANDIWKEFNIVGDQGAIPNLTPIYEADYADLCALYNTLGGDSWNTKWITNKNVQTLSRWRGVTFDKDGYVTSIDLTDNGLKGDISSLTLSGLTKLTSLNLSRNMITGDIMPLANKLPKGCTLNVELQDFGYLGEHTLYELCNYGGLPSIAYYQSQSRTLASTLVGVNGVCQFYHEGTDGGRYWDCYIFADGRTVNNFKFYWPSPATIECFQPHHFTFTYNYEMGDANMDDKLNVLDLQSTLNYSNNQGYGLFNFYAADTYGQDNDINVQDIVSTVNILLAQDNATPARSLRAANVSDTDACIRVENGQVILHTTKPVAALDLLLIGINPEELHWNTEEMGFATATASQFGGTHSIIYSMQQRQIPEGSTVLATFDTHRCPQLASAVLSDIKARPVSVGHSIATGISQLKSSTISRWTLANLAGTCLASGTHATETDIVKLAKSRQLQGVFILNADGVKRKIMIK